MPSAMPLVYLAVGALAPATHIAPSPDPTYDGYGLRSSLWVAIAASILFLALFWQLFRSHKNLGARYDG